VRVKFQVQVTLLAPGAMLLPETSQWPERLLLPELPGHPEAAEFE